MKTCPLMTERITRENLHGVWAAIATPFDADDRFDEGVFRENVRRLGAKSPLTSLFQRGGHSAGVHGIYTTDSDGEFYAIEIDEFRAIVAAFADEARKLGIATQVGVTWSNTSGMLDRLRFAADQGILASSSSGSSYRKTFRTYSGSLDAGCRAMPSSGAPCSDVERFVLV